jgi:hypothetical protein
MSSVVRGGGVTTAQTGSNRCSLNIACPTAIAERQKFAIPIFRRHPQFHLDVGICRWRERGGNAAMRRQLRPTLSSTSCFLRTSRDEFRGGDRYLRY